MASCWNVKRFGDPVLRRLLRLRGQVDGKQQCQCLTRAGNDETLVIDDPTFGKLLTTLRLAMT